MPATRSPSRKVPMSRRSVRNIKSDPENNSALDTEVNNAGDRGQEFLFPENTCQAQLEAFMQSARKFERSMKELQKSNLELRQELDAFRDSAPISPRRRAASANTEAVIKVQKLEGRIKELEKRNAHLHKKLKKLQAKELKAEADELREDLEEGDDVHKMRKLLRDFHGWMTVTTLAEDEDCPICFEHLRPKKAYGLPCQHLVCAECLPQISKGSDETVKCPQCRKAYPREDIEALVFTETERFDGLLRLAAQWALMDHSGEDSSEEAAEKEFIDDGETQSESSDRCDVDEVADEGDQGIEGEDSEAPTPPQSTPESARTASYTESPAREKRKRMEELAQSRNQRRRVL